MLLHLIVFLLVVLLPAGLVVAAPGRWLGATAGWALLAAGLVFILDYIHHPAPYDDDFLDIDLGLLLGGFWAMTVAGALLFRLRATAGAECQTQGSAVLQWAQCWSVPAAILVAVAFLHWLSNRLAGAAPAPLVHLWAVLPPLGLLLFLLSPAGGWTRKFPVWRRLALALPAVFASLVAWDVQEGFAAWSEARAFAAGQPHCLMTYGGFEHRRQARSGWDLSPLVDRHYGVWAVAKTPTLAVATPGGGETYRFHGGRWTGTNERPQCRPQ